MARPILYIFAISHFCEKARWALDYLEVEYQIKHLSPGLHISTTRKLGARHSALPVLVVDGEAIQGSSRIIDWADDHVVAGQSRLNPDSDPDLDACREIEKRLDDVLGIHARRYYYSEALLDQPQAVRPIFSRDLPLLQRLLLRATWLKISKKMITGMDLGNAQGLESKQIVETELDWLDAQLADGRRFLVGDRFSRADLTAASLLAPLALPAEHPTYNDLQIPPGVAADLVAWQQRPSVEWVGNIYRRYR